MNRLILTGLQPGVACSILKEKPLEPLLLHRLKPGVNETRPAVELQNRIRQIETRNANSRLARHRVIGNRSLVTQH